MRISGIGLAISAGEEAIPWELRDTAVSRRYRPVAGIGLPPGPGRFTALMQRALAQIDGVKGPLVVGSCNGSVASWSDEEWARSFQIDGVGAVASAQCASGMHALYLGRALLEAGAPEVTVVAVDIASPPSHDNLEALRVLSDEPAPYTDRATGFQLGEAAVAMRLSRDEGIEIVGPMLGHDLDGDDGIARCLGRLFEHYRRRDPQAIARGLFAAGLDGLPGVSEARRPELVIGQGAGPVAGDRAELAAIAAHVPMDIPIATALPAAGHTLGSSSLLSVAIAAAVYGATHVVDKETRSRAFGLLAARGDATDGRPLGVQRVDDSSYVIPADPVVVCRALGGACGAVIVGDVVAGSRVRDGAWGPQSEPPPLRDPTLRRVAEQAAANRPAEPPDVLVCTLDAPLPPAARIGERILPTSVLEMTPGFIPQLVARAWGFRGAALCLVGTDPEPLLAALRVTHDRVFRVAIRGMHERDVEWIPRG